MDIGAPIGTPPTLPSDVKLAELTLNRGRWHQPRVAVIIVHFDYADFLEDAIISVVDQSYGNIECVVVDDGSSPAHRSKAEEITKKFKQYGVCYLGLDKNCGQILAFYAGLDETSAEFVCPLDPDDRYAETFIDSSLRAHLNEKIYCPVTSTDQYKFRNDELVNGTHAHTELYPRTLDPNGLRIQLDCGPAYYFDTNKTGGFFTSTSSLMFRRGILNLLRPIKKLSYPGAADTYLGHGAHMLGGTLFIQSPLVYRKLHENNAWMPYDFFSLNQIDHRAGAKNYDEICKRDVAAAFLENGARDLFERRFLSKLLYRHFSRRSLALLRQESHHAAELAPPGFAEWRRRWRIRSKK